ncbi:hypothetical protein IFR04_002693 [Cadophora malorum]|uniref:Uncharacterized protein n=1 Tax=Cadophora malorum TaxID=108018 RepID=A0A8H7WFW2_9HELO|nr:hypothetical protein IFR04_002693 [Cadophora malorum]
MNINHPNHSISAMVSEIIPFFPTSIELFVVRKECTTQGSVKSAKRARLEKTPQPVQKDIPASDQDVEAIPPRRWAHAAVHRLAEHDRRGTGHCTHVLMIDKTENRRGGNIYTREISRRHLRSSAAEKGLQDICRV